MADLGRVCRWCGDDDTGRMFVSERCCARCGKQKNRRKCGLCGGPFYAEPLPDRMAGCVLKNRLLTGERCEDQA